MVQFDVDAAARETLRLIGADPQNWVTDRDGVDHNVAIICVGIASFRYRQGDGDRRRG